ncbi:hypothetical protein, partial [Mycobacterium sp. 1164966.3]|uniref:hypothetical protein n=1 Tax=Mycobacterium sp. 1164966.3 TaxID=1856861 RepID=UPI001C12C877
RTAACGWGHGRLWSAAVRDGLGLGRIRGADYGGGTWWRHLMAELGWGRRLRSPAVRTLRWRLRRPVRPSR